MNYCKIGFLVALMAFSFQANATVWTMSATIDGFQEVPPSFSPGTGGGTFIIDDVANTIDYVISFSGLIGIETAAHVHGPAPFGANAGAQFALPSGSPKVGTEFSTPTTVSMMLSGLTYVNIHSTFFPGGEIRGQIVNPVVLPVELSSFSATQVTDAVRLNWRTESETNNDRFFIDRSENGGTFERVGEVLSRGMNGNSSSALSYTHTDRNVTAGATYTYRLSQRDFDGTVHDLRTAQITVNGATRPVEVVEDFRLVSVYPNPFNPTATIRVHLSNQSDAKLSIYNMTGELVRELAVNGSGTQNIQFDATGLAAGNYIVRMNVNGISYGNQRITLLK